ncbi:MAG: leucyl aminopeptidase [Myxococcota bacterium]|nr:leucyl aminopeptidase [Myxococcota bacterium]
MDFRFLPGEPAATPAALLVVPLFENDLSGKQHPDLVATLDGALDGLLTQAAAEEGFKARADQSFTFHTHSKLAAGRVMLVGLGTREAFHTERLRLAAGRAVKNALRLKSAEVAVVVPSTRDPEWAVRAVVEGFVLGGYKFDRYRTRGKDTGKGIKRVSLLLSEGVEKTPALQRALKLGQAVGRATNEARDLVNEPGAVVTPKRLADEARALAKATGLKVTIKGRAEIAKLKMGMFLGVAQGSVLEPQLIHLEYVPSSAKGKKSAPLVLVGKAITFDSGGLSLKTADGMVDMKTDMAGSAAVLGAMRVIAEELQPPFPVHALMGACENMPSGTAYRPGDILISRKGKTVEVTNTDAEGRLVLGDVLTYASELKPSGIVDLATLTGACMVALGHYLVGAFGDDDGLMDEVLESGRAAGEELWRLPIHELQKDALRSEVADMKNSGERYGGAINAAHFLREFVGEVPWVHLDIAGPSQSPKERGYHSKGATGVGVRTLVELIRRRMAAGA